MVPMNRSEAFRPDSPAILPAATDVMPRSLALTLIVGSLLGTGFWATLTALLVR